MKNMTDLSFESEFVSTSLLDMPTFFRTITEIFRKMGKRKKEKEKKGKKKKRKEKRENWGNFVFFFFLRH